MKAGRRTRKSSPAGSSTARIRPLFPEGFKNEVQVFVTVLSADQENDADVLAVLAASAALALSPVPWNGPLAAVRVGRVDGHWILNPTFQQLEFSTIDLVVSGSADSIVMVEGGALEISEQELLDALKVAQKGIKDLVALQKKLVDKSAAPKMKWTKPERDAVVVAKVRTLAEGPMAKAINAKDKAGRSAAVKELRRSVAEQLVAEFPEKGKDIAAELEEIEYRTMRNQVLTKGERVDGRDTRHDPSHQHRDGRPAAYARLGALPARRDAGARGRDARHLRRRAADRQHRLAGRDDEVVHAALQLPAVLHRRSEDDPRHQPPRNRPRRAGRAGAAAAPPGARGLPVHAPHRVGDPRVERLVVDGHRCAAARWR